MLITIQTATRAIELAAKHADKDGDAAESLNDARRYLGNANYDRAFARACDSLDYSVGLKHSDYTALIALSQRDVRAIEQGY